MADQVTIKPQPEPTAGNTPPVSANQTAGLTTSHIISLCALGLLGSFFLPWANVLFGTVSGFDLQKLSDSQKLLWFIPVFCVITVAGGLAGKNQKIAALVTGALPFLALIFWFTQMGGDLLQVLTYGAYISLGLGLALIIVPLKRK